MGAQLLLHWAKGERRGWPLKVSAYGVCAAAAGVPVGWSRDARRAEGMRHRSAAPGGPPCSLDGGGRKHFVFFSFSAAPSGGATRPPARQYQSMSTLNDGARCGAAALWQRRRPGAPCRSQSGCPTADTVKTRAGPAARPPPITCMCPVVFHGRRAAERCLRTPLL